MVKNQPLMVGDKSAFFQYNDVKHGTADGSNRKGYVINGNENGRLSNNDITVFDSTGIALQDLAVADYIIKTAEEKHIGTIVTI